MGNLFFKGMSLSANKVKRLVITSGDISDVDGFFALAEYAKTGMDVLFVMNFPAYVGVVEQDVYFEKENPGLGFLYSAQQVFDNVPKDCPDTYKEFMSKYDDINDANYRMKSAMTDLAFTMATNVWAEVGTAEARGQLFFLIGGANTVNPFSAQAIKNEVLMFSDATPKSSVRIPAQHGAIYDETGHSCKDKFALSDFSEIYIDFNGSMAFFDDDCWLVQALTSADVLPKIRGAFIMGGVEAEKPPQTMPAIAGKLNRLSSATMNQLYHPRNTARFLALLDRHRIPAHVVTNNAVGDLTTWSDPARAHKTYDGVDRFLKANELAGAYLGRLARAYYETRWGSPPPRKAFDYYTALALCRAAREDGAAAADRFLFYSGELGVARVSVQGDWAAALEAYAGGVDVEPAAGDSDFVRAKKESFRRELAAMRGLAPLPSLRVVAAAFESDPDTRRLALCCPKSPAPA